MGKKQEIIKHLTDLMATIQMAYFKGRLGERNGENTGGDGAACGELWVHEEPEARISIDLYNFGGDGKPVCEGLNFLAIVKGRETMVRAYCIGYDPDDEDEPLTILCCTMEQSDVDIPVDIIPEEVLQRITEWIEQKMTPAKQEANDVTRVKEVIALWSDWCMGYDDEDLWLGYMVKHPKGHCNRQHLQEKWDYCYDKYGSKAAMHMFWRELDNDNRTILTEYITTQWQKN